MHIYQIFVAVPLRDAGYVSENKELDRIIFRLYVIAETDRRATLVKRFEVTSAVYSW